MEKHRCGYFHTVYAESSYLGGVHHGVNGNGSNDVSGLVGVRVYMNCVPGCSIQGPARELVRGEKGDYHCPICGRVRIERPPENKEQDLHLRGIPDWWIKESRENGRPL